MAPIVVASAPVCFVFRWPSVPTQDVLTRAAGSRVDLTPPPRSAPLREAPKEPLVTAVWTSNSAATLVADRAEGDGLIDCIGDCAMDILGIKDIIALGGVAAGFPTIMKPKPGALGSGARTSPLSLWLGEKLPQKLPQQIRTYLAELADGQVRQSWDASSRASSQGLAGRCSRSTSPESAFAP